MNSGLTCLMLLKTSKAKIRKCLWCIWTYLLIPRIPHYKMSDTNFN